MSSFNYNRFEKHYFKSATRALSYLIASMNDGAVQFADVWKLLKQKVAPKGFLSVYFRNVDSHPGILSFFLEHERETVLTQVKLNKAFMGSHRTALEITLASDTELLNEFSLWRNLWEENGRELKECTRILAPYNLQDTLILCGCLYEKKRLTERLSVNEDADLIEEINSILNQKFQQQRKVNAGRFKAYSPEEFVVRVNHMVMELGIHGDEELEVLYSVHARLKELNYLYDLYCYHGFSICSKSGTVHIMPGDEKSYLRFKATGMRYRMWHQYFFNIATIALEEEHEAIEATDMSWYNRLSAERALSQLFQWYDSGAPADLRVLDTKLNVHSFLRIVNSLGSWSNIRWNQFIHRADTRVKNPYATILSIMRYNLEEYKNDASPVLFRTHHELISQAEEINHTERGSVRLSLKLLTNNVDDSALTALNISDKPFIKIGTSVYWIAGILSDKNYAVMLQNILMGTGYEITNEKDRKKVNRRAEDELEELFTKNEFRVIARHKMKSARGGEMDVLAFKDNTLFICELKSTYFRSSIKDIHEHFYGDGKGISEAQEQLEYDVAYIRGQWKILSAQFKTELPFDEIVVVPLAVTSTLEDGHRKIRVENFNGYIVSLFELRIILNNHKAYMMDIFGMALRNHFGTELPGPYADALSGQVENPQLVQEIRDIVTAYHEQHPTETNLWKEGNALCSAEDLQKSLEEETAWDWIEKVGIWEGRMRIGEVDVKYGK